MSGSAGGQHNRCVRALRGSARFRWRCRPSQSAPSMRACLHLSFALLQMLAFAASAALPHAGAAISGECSLVTRPEQSIIEQGVEHARNHPLVYFAGIAGLAAAVVPLT